MGTEDYAWRHGLEDRAAGVPVYRCPYIVPEVMARWEAGWRSSQAERRELEAYRATRAYELKRLADAWERLKPGPKPAKGRPRHEHGKDW